MNISFGTNRAVRPGVPKPAMLTCGTSLEDASVLSEKISGTSVRRHVVVERADAQRRKVVAFALANVSRFGTKKYRCDLVLGTCLSVRDHGTSFGIEVISLQVHRARRPINCGYVGPS